MWTFPRNKKKLTFVIGGKKMSPARRTVASLGLINKSVSLQRKGVTVRTSKRSLSRHQRPTKLRRMDLFFCLGWTLCTLPLLFNSWRGGMSETEMTLLIPYLPVSVWDSTSLMIRNSTDYNLKFWSAVFFACTHKRIGQLKEIVERVLNLACNMSIWRRER